jgi:hypothetical protein
MAWLILELLMEKKPRDKGGSYEDNETVATNSRQRTVLQLG